MMDKALQTKLHQVNPYYMIGLSVKVLVNRKNPNILRRSLYKRAGYRKQNSSR